MRIHNLAIFLSFLIGIAELKADNAAWINSSGDFWDLNTNWTAPYPNAIDAAAGFVGQPSAAGLQIINSGSSITVGSLVFDTTRQVSLNFGGNSLIFQTSTDNAQIIASGSFNNFISSPTPLVLNSNLNIFIDIAPEFDIQSPISGSGKLSLYASSGRRLDLSGLNSYVGGTEIHSGILDINQPDNVIGIPGDISVFKEGTVFHLNNNNYSSNTAMTIIGGIVDLSGTAQSMKTLTVAQGGILINSGKNTGSLDLFALPGDAALTVSDNAEVNPFMINVNPLMINIINGGGIFYDAITSGTAYLSGPTTIDLQLNSIDFHIPHNFQNCIDLQVIETIFQNGTLNKTNNGVALLLGVTVPTFNIQNGTIVIGDQVIPFTVTATGPITITSPGQLTGFNTLFAQMGIINSGTVKTGGVCNGCDTIATLTIQGNFEQTAEGTLFIKALNSSSSDHLIVDSGTVILNGELNFEALPEAIFNPGDQIVIIDNTNEATPISGRFATFTHNLPSCLQATLEYTPNQVLVNISNCSGTPCTACSPSPPSHFEGNIERHRDTFGCIKCSLKAKWRASPSQDVVSYRIYKNGHHIKTISATSKLVFKVKHLKHCTLDGYEIAAVNSSNQVSCRVRLRKD